jgi:hypothetical protein
MRWEVAMSIAIAQWVESSFWGPRAHRSYIMHDSLLMWGGLVIAVAFLWPVVLLGFLLVLYGS